MTRNYCHHLDNIYKKSRLIAGISRISAVSKLFISLRSLDYYESSQIPPEDVVKIMVTVYNDPGLMEKHKELKRKRLE